MLILGKIRTNSSTVLFVVSKYHHTRPSNSVSRHSPQCPHLPVTIPLFAKTHKNVRRETENGTNCLLIVTLQVKELKYGHDQDEECVVSFRSYTQNSQAGLRNSKTFVLHCEILTRRFLYPFTYTT
jgi:hypothetical protein